MTDLILPVIHLNGTSQHLLIDQLAAVSDALDTAYAALKQAAPNGRDYYPDPGRMEKALEQHRRWQLAIDAIKNEIDGLIMAIDDTE